MVSRKLRSSCWVKAAIRPLTVMNLLAGLASAGGMDSPLSILSLSAVAIAGAAVTFPKLQARLAGKLETDFGTARRLFTLICVLQMRG